MPDAAEDAVTGNGRNAEVYPPVRTPAEIEDKFFDEINAQVAADKAAKEAEAAGGVPSVEANPASAGEDAAPSAASRPSPAAPAKPKKKRKGRAAGESSYYRIAVDVSDDGKGWSFRIVPWDDEYSGPELPFVSVSNVAKLASDSGPLIGWAWNVTTEGIAILGNQLDLRGMTQDQIKGLLKEIGQTPWKKRQTAADRGTGTHSVMEILVKGEPFVVEHETEPDREVSPEEYIDTVVPPVERGYSHGVLKWHREQQPKPLLVEEALVSFRHRVAGTGDIGAVRNVDKGPVQGTDIPVFTDLKTSKGIYDEAIHQVNGYLMCAAELHAMGVPNRYFELGSVLRVTPDGDYEEKFFEPDPTVFIALTDLWWARTAFEQKAKEGK